MKRELSQWSFILNGEKHAMEHLFVERFDDMQDADQIRRALMLEEIAGRMLCDSGWGTVRSYFRKAGITITKELALFYAKKSDERNAEHALRWYEVIDYAFNDPLPLRRHLIENGHIDRLRQRFDGTGVTRDELFQTTNACLLRADVSLEDCGCEALSGCVLLNYTKGIEQLLRTAIANGNEAFSLKCASEMGRQLTPDELVEIICVLLARRRYEEALATARRYGVASHYAQCFDGVIMTGRLPYAIVAQTAAELGIEMTHVHLTKLLDARYLDEDDTLLVARDLDIQVPGTFGRIVSEMRKRALDNGDVLKTKRYGHNVNKPLSIQELHEFISKHGSDPMTEDHKKKIGPALDLLARRIWDVVRARAALNANQNVA
jgi:hypothetical protein